MWVDYPIVELLKSPDGTIRYTCNGISERKMKNEIISILYTRICSHPVQRPTFAKTFNLLRLHIENVNVANYIRCKI